MTRLSALETAYLRAEHPGTPLHVASVAFFEAAPFFNDDGSFRLETLRLRVGERLGLLPRLRQRLAEVPFAAGRPVWVDDADFDIANHVEVVAAPHPGDDHALMTFVTERYSELLDRAHPLWHLLFITGVADDRVVLLERVHHSLVDGVGGVGIATVLLDVERDPAERAYPLVPIAADEPSLLALLRDAVAERALQPGRVIGTALAHAVRHPTAAVSRGRDLVTSLSAASGDGWRAPRSSLNAPVGSSRQITFVRERLDTFREAGKPHGATVNDVVLSVVTGALRELLLSRGEFLASTDTLKALVPVSLRAPAAAGALGNEVAGLLVPLPVGIGDPRARLAAVTATTRRLKESHEDATSMAMMGSADMLPPRLLAQADRAIASQPFVNLVITNVPGPPFPLYALGAEMLEAFPIVPVAGNLTIGVAVLSYNGALNLGVTSDPETCPDAAVFVAGLHHSLAALSAEWANAD